MAAMIFAASCRGGGGEPAFTHEGEHVVVHAGTEHELCGGSIAYMDDFVRRISYELGISAPRGDERIRFHWESPEVIEEICGGPVAGCTPDDEVFTQYAPHNHELVHAVVAPFGLPRSLFAEGLAVLYEGLGASPHDHYSLGAADDVLALVDASQEEFVDLGGYRLAGAFTAYLVGRFGMEEYLEMYKRVDRFSDVEDIDRAFGEVFGVSLMQSLSHFEAQPGYLGVSCPHGSYDSKILECDAPEVAWDGKVLSMERTISCEHADAVGPFDDKVLVLHTISISVGGHYELRMHGDLQDADPFPDFGLGDRAVTGVSIRRCGGCGDGEWMATWEGSTPRVSELRPGLYALRLHGAAAASVGLGFTLALLPEPSGPPGELADQ